MPGDDFKKVSTGDPLEWSSRWYNATIDAIEATKKLPGQGAKPSQAPPRACDVVKIKNAGETDCKRFEILGIDTIRFTPTDNLTGFKETPILSCVEPTDDHRGKFVILLQPAKAANPDGDPPVMKGDVVDACIAGYVNVSVNVTDEGHEWADVKPGDTTQLQSAASGSARIIWKESGTGKKWALVRIDNFTGFWAKLGNEDPDNPGRYRWVEQVSNGYSLSDGSRSSGTDYTAVDANTREGLKGTIVWVRFDGFEITTGDDGPVKKPVYRFEQGGDVLEVGIVQSIAACSGQCVTQPSGGGPNTTVNLIFPLGPVKVNFAVGDAIVFIRSSASSGDAVQPDIGEPAMVYDLVAADPVKVKKLTALVVNSVHGVDGINRGDFNFTSESPSIDGVTFCGTDPSGVGLEWAGFIVAGGNVDDGPLAIDDRRKIQFDYTSGDPVGTACEVRFSVAESGDRTALISAAAYVDLGSIPTPPAWAVYTGDGTWINVTVANVIEHIGPGAQSYTRNVITSLTIVGDGTLRISFKSQGYDAKGHETGLADDQHVDLELYPLDLHDVKFEDNKLQRRAGTAYVPKFTGWGDWSTLVEFEDCDS